MAIYAMYGMQSRFTKEDYGKLRSQGINLHADAKFPAAMAAGITIDPSFTLDLMNNKSETWNKVNKNKKSMPSELLPQPILMHLSGKN